MTDDAPPGVLEESSPGSSTSEYALITGFSAALGVVVILAGCILAWLCFKLRPAMKENKPVAASTAATAGTQLSGHAKNVPVRPEDEPHPNATT